MSRAAKLVALAGLALLATLALAGCARIGENQPDATDTRTAVRALFDSYVDALNRSDSTGVLSAYAPDSQPTMAGRDEFFRGQDAIGKTAGETLLNPGQNTYELDSLDVIPIEKAHALALVEYAVEPSDQDIPAFHTTATYVLEKAGAKWRIIHAHVCPAREQ